MEGHTALVTYQREYVHDSGRKITVEVHEQLLKHSDGAIAGMRMASIDVTERKNSEDAAYQNATELRALFQAFPDLFLRLDKNETVLDAKGGQSSGLVPERGQVSRAGICRTCCRPSVLAQVRERAGKSPQQPTPWRWWSSPIRGPAGREDL